MLTFAELLDVPFSLIARTPMKLFGSLKLKKRLAHATLSRAARSSLGGSVSMARNCGPRNCGPTESWATSRDAEASVSVAVTYDGLVASSHAVVVATPVEEHAQMEDGKIFTYTRLHVDNAVAGDAGTGSDVYVRSFGGIIDHIGMVSEGEPTFSVGQQQLLFLRHSVPGAYNVTADAQGQFTVVADAVTPTAAPKVAASAGFHFRRSRSVGLVLAPKVAAQVTNAATSPGWCGSGSSGAASQTSIVAPTVSMAPAGSALSTPALAADVLEARATTDVVRDLATAFKRLHAH